ncbi:MAG: DUF2812 domain-containing protein, partial [Chloroflexi bacterium]|nr:DUF2812 domain-containing protein [Chloroflexota bacterium]
MNAETRKVFKWFWAWDDEKEEAWLREMAVNGWRLTAPELPASYTFKKAEPQDMVYRLDFFRGGKTSHAEYLQLFLDAGWEYVGDMSGWNYFRTPAQGDQAPEIYTDNEGKIQK